MLARSGRLPTSGDYSYELSLADALAFCLLLADADPPRFDCAIARGQTWPTRCVRAARRAMAICPV
jgi:hypothetical protein